MNRHVYRNKIHYFVLFIFYIITQNNFYLAIISFYNYSPPCNKRMLLQKDIIYLFDKKEGKNCEEGRRNLILTVKLSACVTHHRKKLVHFICFMIFLFYSISRYRNSILKYLIYQLSLLSESYLSRHCDFILARLTKLLLINFIPLLT